MTLLELSGLKAKIQTPCCNECGSDENIGYNQALIDLSALSIEFDREELARYCYMNCAFDIRPWTFVPDKDKKMYFDMADHLISNSSKFMKVVRK